MEKKPAILFGTPQAPSAASDQPKIVAAGETRRRIPCSLAQLEVLDPTAVPDVVAQALQAVNGVNLDDHYFEDVVRFGANLQAEHGRLAEAQLDIVSNYALASARANYLELVERLERLDPERVFGIHTGPLATVKRFFQGDLAESDFEQEYARIKRLAKSVQTAMPAVEAAVQGLKRLARRHTTLMQSLKAHVLACRFIGVHIDATVAGDESLNAHYQSQRTALESRELSLSATCATVEMGRQSLKVLAQSLDDFGLLGVDFTHEELPAWYAAFSTALLARRMRSDEPGPFERALTAHQQLLSKLKRKEVP